MCGVFGIRAPERDVARVAHFALHALQHRGQEAAGIAVSEDGRLTVLRELGLLTQFKEQKLRGLHGDVAIGHTRYSTTGSGAWANAQPLVHHGRARTVALGHNGNLVNAGELREELAAEGAKRRLDLRLGADRRGDRPRSAAARRGGAGGDGAARGRVLGDGDRRRHAARVPRPARLPPALARPARRRLGGRVGDVRVRPARRRARARGGAAASSCSSTATACARSRPCRRPATARSASSSSSTSRDRTRISPASRRTLRASGWASGSPPRLRSRPTSSCRSPTRERRRRSASHAPRASRSAKG